MRCFCFFANPVGRADDLKKHMYIPPKTGNNNKKQKGENVMLKNKKFQAVLIACAVISAGVLLYLPKAVMKSIPAASPVKVQKLEFNDSADVTGSIVKNIGTGEYLIQTFVGEKEISAVKIGQAAEITGDAFPERLYNGEVKAIADTASKIQFGNTTRTMVEVTVLITDADDFLKPGYTANVSIKTSEPAVLTILPYEAVAQDNGGEYVYILQDGVALKRYIETGRELSQGVEVVSGITAFDSVITVSKPDIDGKTVILSD